MRDTGSPEIARAILELTLPARRDRVRDAREAARAFGERHGVERPDDVALAISEVVVNAVLHAYEPAEAGSVRIAGARIGDRVVFVVQDRGRGTGPAGGHPRGLGLSVAAAVAEHLDVGECNGGGTEVRIEFAAPA